MANDPGSTPTSSLRPGLVDPVIAPSPSSTGLHSLPASKPGPSMTTVVVPQESSLRRGMARASGFREAVGPVLQAGRAAHGLDARDLDVRRAVGLLGQPQGNGDPAPLETT